MKYIHNLTITSLVKTYEDVDKTKDAFLEFLPFDLEKENIFVEETELKAEYGDDMLKYGVKIAKERHNKAIISNLKEMLGNEQIKRLIEEENRIDEEGYFYLRIDRKKFEDERKAILTDGGDCFHFKIMLAAFPKTREKAIEVAKELWSK